MERNHDETRWLEKGKEEEAAKITNSTKVETASPSVKTTLKMETFGKNWRPPANNHSRRMDDMNKKTSLENRVDNKFEKCV